MVGYRDSAYLYYPYFQWIDQQWQKGEIPLWNPYCDLGYPVVADGTSSVFYPGKLIFLVRVLDYPARYGLYLSLHVLWAASCTYLLVLKLRGSPIGAGVAAASYAFGGSVLFQVTNVVYLVSASWLPLGLLCLVGMTRERGYKHAVYASVIAAMMVLGGDPQMAYMLSLILVVSMLVRLIWCRKKYLTWRLWFGRLSIIFRQILVFGLGVFLLSAIQVLPTYYWAQQSVRANASDGRSHSQAVYQFSQPPWTVAEIMWPNFSGKPFPIHQRWANALPGNDRVWVPSLYVGLFVAMFAFATVRFFFGNWNRVWLTWIALVFGLASFGWYGPIWMYKELTIGFGMETSAVVMQVDSYVGGVYWLMTVLLPGFESFRYPAKLFPVASLAISVLAGIGFDRGLNWKLVLAMAAAVGMAIILGNGPIENYVSHHAVANDGFFGPFDSMGMASQINASVVHVAVLVCLLAIVFVVYFMRPILRSACLVVLFVALIADLMVANAWLLCQVEAEVFTRTSKVSELIRSEGFKIGAARLKANRSGPPIPFRRIASLDRLAEIVAWQRESLHPKHHLVLPDDAKVGICGSFSSIDHPASQKWRCETLGAGPRLRPVINGEVDCKWPSRGPYVKLYTTLDSKFSLVDAKWDLGTLGFHSDFKDSQVASFSVIEETESRILIFVDSEAPVSMLCSMLPIAGWNAKVTRCSDDQLVNAKIKEAGEFHLAVDVPAGKHQVVFSYQPIEFWIGATISLIGWLLLAVWLVGLNSGVRFAGV